MLICARFSANSLIHLWLADAWLHRLATFFIFVQTELELLGSSMDKSAGKSMP